MLNGYNIKHNDSRYNVKGYNNSLFNFSLLRLKVVMRIFVYLEDLPMH